MTNVPKIKVDLTKVQNEPIREDYLDRIMKDAYCPKCGKLMGDGEYGCMCDDGIDDKEWVDNAKAIASNEVEENEKAIGRAWTQEEIDEELNDCGSKEILRNVQRRIQCDKYCNKYLSRCVGAFDECFEGINLKQATINKIGEIKAYNKMLKENSIYQWHDAKTDLPENDYAKLCFTTDAVMAYEVMRYEFDKQGNGYWKGSLVNVTHYENSEHPYVIAWMDLPEVPEEFK